MSISKAEHEKLANLSNILLTCAEYEEEFWNFASDHEELIRIALYAKNVTDGFAIATKELIAACDSAVELLQDFLSEADSDES